MDQEHRNQFHPLEGDPWMETDSDDETELYDVEQLDGDYIGDILQEDKPPNTTRMYFHNLNGLKWDTHGGTWPVICQAMAGIHADIACFSEVNQDTLKFSIREKMSDIAHTQFDHVRMVTATSNRKVKRAYKPGGTAMLTMQDTVAYSKEPTRDRMGRWVSTRYSSGNGSNVTVIGAYQVCQTRRAGQATAATQQINQMLEEAAARGSAHHMDPRGCFIRDLTALIQQRQETGDQVVLGGDFNEVMSENSGIHQLASVCGLIDVFSQRFETVTRPATFKGGSNRLDYVLLSPTLVPYIKASGYEPYDYRGVFSDHRAMYLDFASDLLFGDQPIPLASLSQRDFRANDPEAVRKYIESKYAELLNHNILERLSLLEEMQDHNPDFVERIDRDMERAAIIATKTVKSYKRFPWSPQLSKAWAVIHYYKICLSQIRRPEVNLGASIIKWRSQNPGLPDDAPGTEAAAKQRIREAYRSLQRIRQQASEHRRQHLDHKADVYAALGDTNKERILERMRNAESLHRAFNKLRNIRNPERSTGLTSIQVPRDPSIDPKQCPKDNEHWRTIRAPREVEELLIARNRKHFGQAQGTPLTSPAIWSHMLYDGTGQICDMLLEGQYENEDLDEAAQLFLQQMTALSVHQCSPCVSVDEFVGKLRNWNETTTTSPSGLHLGHYHALWKPAAFTKEETAQQAGFEVKRSVLIRVHVALINYAIRFGYPLQRWRKVVNIMLEKEPGSPRIHRLRVIHIYEADYNLMLAVKWREAMYNAEDQRLLHADAYGSRPGRSAHDPIALEVWRNGIYRTSMKRGVNQDLDATSCYDRILPPIASICSRRVGIHPQVATINCRTLEKATFHLKTSLGTSSSHYSHCEEFPIYGTGQGSGNSPHIWCFISSALFDAYDQRANGAYFRSFDSKQEVKLTMVGFVDDCNQGVNDFSASPQPSSETLVEMMRHDSQLWNDLLWTSGGALELPKCSFQLIESQWNRHGTPFLQGGKEAPIFQVRNGDAEIVVKQTGNYESRKSLGVHLNPAGKMKKQLNVLMSKSRKFQECLMANVLSRREATMMYHGIYLPSVTYPMAVTHLTEDECHRIETPFLQVLIPRVGYARTMSRAIRCAPTTWGGAGFRTLYGEQTVASIQLAIRSLRSTTNPGRLLWINLTWAQAYSGLSAPLWEQPNAPCPAVPEPWIMGVRKALAKINGKIVLEKSIVCPLQRENDWYIMDRVMDMSFKSAEVEGINSCRRFLQSVTAADVCNSAGTHISTHKLDGSSSIDQSNVNGEVFNQKKPSEEAWRSWRLFWRRVSRGGGLRLQTPLRSWILEGKDCRLRPEWVWDPIRSTLFQRQDAGCYRPLIQQAGGYVVAPTVLEPRIPSGYPVHVTDIGRHHVIRHNYQVLMSFPEQAANWEEYIMTLDQWERELLSFTTLKFSINGNENFYLSPLCTPHQRTQWTE